MNNHPKSLPANNTGQPEIDAFDLSILKSLQEDCQQSSQALAQKIALSPTAIQRRIKRLRADGVIKAEQAVLDAEKFGSYLRLIVMLRLQRGGREINAKFQQSLSEIKEIQQSYAVAGEFDYVLMLLVKNMSDYERIGRDFFQNNDMVERYQTTVVMEVLEQSLKIPL
ncbi:Lrp/AsnC family transcriptional regulator [Undibacterium cyanobacteriorum]|uniref:Lrp/AsnC family transcriptional regulator n=1 Tax=Undibacterium cyanobacteriorum TaxID=3073561 RepID=A0ABY9RER7_9BURK|nr:Lrp/AsnC family transcriptional regulator [Undibacterium sp. 20NA77.5]WMW79679.1 Lrp/AsnC family transcriptional regulator [Undibacterium sp. 20NA77.5]